MYYRVKGKEGGAGGGGAGRYNYDSNTVTLKSKIIGQELVWVVLFLTCSEWFGLVSCNAFTIKWQLPILWRALGSPSVCLHVRELCNKGRR